MGHSGLTWDLVCGPQGGGSPIQTLQEVVAPEVLPQLPDTILCNATIAFDELPAAE